MALAEANPRMQFNLDLEEKVLQYEGGAIPVEMPGTARTSLIEGYWDSTATLAANAAKVRQVADRLPYVSGFRQ
jgi:hypothetical protein